MPTVELPTAPFASRDQIDELLAYLEPDELRQLQRDVLALAPKPKGKPVPADWEKRIPLTFPRYASAPFAERHRELWRWENGIRLESAPDPFVALWPRGGAKSTSAEMAVADLGCRSRRRYCIYVRMTQDKADASVENIAALFESPEVERHYPEHGKRMTGKFGNPKGWRRNRVWTAGGFVVDALGLDTASRGVKVEDQRPDIIVFDDIDDLLDSPATTKKKADIITKSILPAGANNVAVLFIQNVIIRDGIAAQLADGRADYLAKRIVSGPFPAVDGLETEWQVDQRTGTRRAIITAGRATWAGQDLETCQRNIDQWGLSAFLKEAQHKVTGKAEGVVLDKFNPTLHYIDIRDDQLAQLAPKCAAFGGIDFGAWRFGFTLWFATPSKVVIRIDELFSQRESLRVRARKIHELCVHAGIAEPSPKNCPIWGDAANPQDIMEINLAFRAGWVDNETGKRITSKLRVIAVAAEHKLRRVAVERMNNALEENTLRFRRSVAPKQPWRLGMNAGNLEGTETAGSRLMWEIDNWAVPVPKEGEAQDQNPDDDTADGADLIASSRYALMSHWKVKKPDSSDDHVADDRAWDFDVERRKFVEPKHASDRLFASKRRAPAVRAPRPRIGR